MTGKEVQKMSSILRALKKIEKKPQEKKTVKSWLLESAAQRASGRGRVLRIRIFYILLAAPFLLIGGWQLYKYGPIVMELYFPEKPRPKLVETRGKNVPVGVNRLPARAQLKPPAKQPSAAAAARKSRVATRKNTIAPSSGTTVSEKRVKNVIAGVKNTTRRLQSNPMGKRSQTAPAATIKTRAASPKSVIAPRKGVPFSIKSQKPDSRPVKTGSTARAGKPYPEENSGEIGFEVQAIAWSSTPEQRIAVINGGVVREGEYVDGAYVAKIGLDDVSLQKDGKTWQLRCGR